PEWMARWPCHRRSGLSSQSLRIRRIDEPDDRREVKVAVPFSDHRVEPARDGGGGGQVDAVLGSGVECQAEVLAHQPRRESTGESMAGRRLLDSTANRVVVAQHPAVAG